MEKFVIISFCGGPLVLFTIAIIDEGIKRGYDPIISIIGSLIITGGFWILFGMVAKDFIKLTEY